MDDGSSEYEEAIAIGQENLELLLLADAWCQNISHTRGPLGMGIPEAMTGLPISGGSLRCDFAKPPRSYGMQLAHSAVAFYEENCIGCPERVPTDAVEHLGTWADALIAEREKRAAAAAQQRRDADKASKRRAVDRRVLHGETDPASQAILDLLDRVDAVERDQEAEELLTKHAEMAPGDFPHALVDHLVKEAIVIGNSAFLEAAIAIFERQGRPEADTMLAIAFRAVEKNIARGSAGRVIATHASKFDVDHSSLAGLVHLAAGEPDHLRDRRVGAEPAALLRFFDYGTDATVRLFKDMLQDADVWVRADAAHAAEKVVAARPAAGPLLLPALLDSLQQPDDSRYFGDPFAASQVARVVANTFVTRPLETDEELHSRIRQANPALARRLWDCYERACPSRFREQVPQQVTDTIIRRSLLLLEADLDWELLRDIADALPSLCRHQGLEPAVLIPSLLRLVLDWSSRLQAIQANEPEIEDLTAETFFAFESRRILLSAILDRLQRALESIAKQDPNAYISLIEPDWQASDAQPERVPLINVLQAVVHSQPAFDRTLPLLRHSLASSTPGARAAALRVIGATRTPDVSVPPDLGARVVEAFEDEFLIVLLGAIRATFRVDVPEDQKPTLIYKLLGFVASYGPQALHRHDVANAMRLSLRLAAGEPYEEKIGQLLLDTIKAFPSGEAADHIRKLGLEGHPSWPAAVVSALRVDTRPEYRDLGDSDREALLRALATRSRDELTPHFSDLVEIASQRLPDKPWWAGAVADLLALHQEHSRAAVLADKVVEMFPDTPEQRPTRQLALQGALGHRANAAAVQQDRDGMKNALSEWSQLVSGDDALA